jgi:hypothetical protein
MNIPVDLDAPSFGGVGRSFIRYEFMFDVETGPNELALKFMNHRHLEFQGLDTIRVRAAGLFPTPINEITGQFSNEFGDLIGPSIMMDDTAQGLAPNFLGSNSIPGAPGGLDIISHDFHIFINSPVDKINIAGSVVFDVNDVAGGSIAIGDWAPSGVPEPTSLAIFGALGIVVSGIRRRKKIA